MIIRAFFGFFLIRAWERVGERKTYLIENERKLSNVLAIIVWRYTTKMSDGSEVSEEECEDGDRDA